MSVLAAVTLIACLPAQVAGAETSAPPEPELLLIDLWASGGDGNVNAQAERDDTELTPGWTPGAGADSDQASGTLGSDPYIDLVSQNAWTPLCDAVDDEGNLGDCPEALEDLAEEEEITPADVELLIQQAFQSLPVAPSPISYQPDGDWAAVNMDFIVYTDTAEQVLSTTILDVPVTFRLTPSHWTWDFGDGSPATPSSSPGAAYPNQTISHVYSSASDGVTVSLTTLWSGQFQIAGSGDWYPVDGFVTTTASTAPIEIVAFDVHLVPNQG